MKRGLTTSAIFASTLFYSALAEAQVQTGLPGITATSNPTDFIKSIYGFALLIGGALALGAIVYGGIKYITAAGNPSSQTEGKEWIKGSIFGLILLFGAYMVLNFINPDITTLSLPTLTPIPASQVGGGPITGGGPGGGLTDAQARALLNGTGIDPSVNLAGIQQSTIDELINLKKNCPGCVVIVTAAAGSGHSTKGECSHANGFKADVRPNLSVDNFLTHLPSAGRRGDGATLYKSPSGGLYADERTKPSNCGSTCEWSAPHWDMAVGC